VLEALSKEFFSVSEWGSYSFSRGREQVVVILVIVISVIHYLKEIQVDSNTKLASFFPL
jgi:hypothetical protein